MNLMSYSINYTYIYIYICKGIWIYLPMSEDKMSKTCKQKY